MLIQWKMIDANRLTLVGQEGSSYLVDVSVVDV